MRYCVFSGSNSGVRADYTSAADELGELLGSSGIGLVYGGSSVGLMATIANSTLKAGGEVIGVIPRFLADREVAHKGLNVLRIVSSMHERKALMAELSDGFIALPGGIGTLEETFEVWTWAQLGHHRKPCALLNCVGFYDGLTSFLDHIVEEGFLKAEHRNTLISERTPRSLLLAMKEFEPSAPVSKWVGRE